ncbi:type IV pilin N-terminal domain-containing protein [Halomontanus rarus]|uniref:type IV pilin N-terminal domain-containing protein n=1 Tax=Halomontanus rarus TaxID=3034020 RepID=UPI0023E8420C|nr:type IV pilin N-terminal domain-containing protein [Halovivax sp. TS33]
MVNLLNSTDSDSERAVSPVIGVILMVAITVILAAVIAAFVLDLGQSTGANPQAAVTFSEDGDGLEIKVISVERADDLFIIGSGDCEAQYVSSDYNSDSTSDAQDRGSVTLGTSAGSTTSMYLGSATSSEPGPDYICQPSGTAPTPSSGPDGDDITAANSGTIQVIGVYDGNEGVIQEHDL